MGCTDVSGLVRKYKGDLMKMNQFWRILRPNGVASHRVDLKDHLGRALNSVFLVLISSYARNDCECVLSKSIA